MLAWPAPITDVQSKAEALRRWRRGVIEVRSGRLVSISWRPTSKRVTRLGSWTVGRLVHRRKRGDVCRLYYYQPRSSPEFLVVSYAVSYRDATLASMNESLRVLEQIAAVRGTYALVGDISNERISDRLLARWGWERHATQLFGRNFIKRLREW
jgi:acyl-CoA synthetase (AMP-forming)/AMP-acid ligase II